MEKADILEMTVAYLRAIYRCPPPTSTGAGSPESAAAAGGGGRYAAGYRQCAVEVARYLADAASRAAAGGDWRVDAVRAKLMRHLTAALQTDLLRQHDDHHRPAMTSLPPEPEVAESCDSSPDAGVGSPAAATTSSDVEEDASPTSTSRCSTLDDEVDAATTTPPSPRDREISTLLAVESPSDDRPRSADVYSLREARSSVDCCVWRPW